MKPFFALVLSVLIFNVAVAGDKPEENPKRTGFTFGGSFGVNFSSGKNAMFYNGAPDKENSVQALFQISAVRDSVYRQAKDFFVDTIYSNNMKYQTAMSVAGFLGYVLENQSTIFLQLEYMKLSTGGVVQFQMRNPSRDKYQNGNYYNADIEAQESRMEFNVGYHYPFTHKGYFNPFVEGMAGFNFVKVLKHDIVFGTYRTKMNYYTTYNQTYTNTSTDGVSQGGMGYGFSLGSGLEGPLTSKIFYNMGITFSMKSINLLPNAGLTPHESVYLRFLL